MRLRWYSFSEAAKHRTRWPQHMVVRPGTREKPRMDESSIRSSHVNLLAGRLGGLKDTALDHSLGQGRPCQLGTVGDRPPHRGRCLPQRRSQPLVFSEQCRVCRWKDPVLAQNAHDPRSGWISSPPSGNSRLAVEGQESCGCNRGRYQYQFRNSCELFCLHTCTLHIRSADNIYRIFARRMACIP